jgi:hypothetical protein
MHRGISFLTLDMSCKSFVFFLPSAVCMATRVTYSSVIISSNTFYSASLHSHLQLCRNRPDALRTSFDLHPRLRTRTDADMYETIRQIFVWALNYGTPQS